MCLAYASFRLISIARYVLTLQVFGFDGQNMEFSVNISAFYIVTGPAVSVMVRLLIRISYLALYVLVRFFFRDAEALLPESYTFV